MKFSNREKIDLLKGWAAISVAFSILMSSNLGLKVFMENFFMSGFTVGLAFLLHELGHKYLAQKYNCWAEFRSFDIMLVLAIVMSFFGFIFAAPGAVMISGSITRKKNGKISAMGPAVNIALALIFLVLYYIGVFRALMLVGFYVNSFIGLFNMLPVWNFDGIKIWRWNKPVYISMVAVSLLFVVAYSFII